MLSHLFLMVPLRNMVTSMALANVALSPTQGHRISLGDVFRNSGMCGLLKPPIGPLFIPLHPLLSAPFTILRHHAVAAILETQMQRGNMVWTLDNIFRELASQDLQGVKTDSSF